MYLSVFNKFLITLFIVVFSSQYYANSNIKIAINPGHGLLFNDETNEWNWQREEFHGIREDLLTPEFAIILNDLLLQEDFTTYPLRELDKNRGIGESGLDSWQESARAFIRAKGDVPEYIWNTIRTSNDIAQDIYSRVLYSDYLDTDVLINIHTNGSIAGDLTGEGDKTGTQTFYCNQEINSNNQQSRLLAEAVHHSIINNVKTRFDENWNDGGIFPFNHGENCLATNPAIIVEVGFHDKATPDAEYLQDIHFRQVVSEAMKEGIKDYLMIESNLNVPTASSTPRASQDEQNQTINIQWEIIDPEYNYRLYRCESLDASVCKEIYSGKQNSFKDSKVSLDITYYYRTKSCNSKGCDDLFSNNSASIIIDSSSIDNTGGGVFSKHLLLLLLLTFRGTFRQYSKTNRF